MRPGGYLIFFFLVNFPVEWRQNHVWGPIFDPSYVHIYKCDYFGYTPPTSPSIERVGAHWLH